MVVRRDSGWQAATSGEYIFPGNALVTHPGVVSRIVNARNIRDTGQFVDAGGVQVAGVRFDGDLQIENVAGGSQLVQARDQVGYVQLTPASGGSLSPNQYQALIAAVGPLGGVIDCAIDIGGGGQLMKMGRVGIGVTTTPGGPEFVMTAWGSPQFAQGGQWSFLRQVGTGSAPGLIDTARGVPLIRVGSASSPVPQAPYRFADPEDLAHPDSPASDYGIVHATGTQRVFFPRPQIDPATSDRITSTQTPVLADPYSLANALGYFPRTDKAIPFPDNNYALVISGGNYRLEMPAPSFPVTVGKRTLAATGSMSTFVDYTGSTAELIIDTAASVPWTFKLAKCAVGASTTARGELMRIVGDIQADANSAGRLANPRMVFSPSFGIIRDVFPFFDDLPIPTPLGLSMTNSLALKLGIKIPMDDELNKGLPTGGLKFVDTDVTIGFEVHDPIEEFGFEANATIFVPTDFPPLKGVGLFNFDAQISTEFGTALDFKFGGGVGVDFQAEAFEAYAYLVETIFLILGDVISLGGGLLLKGGIDLKVVEVELSAEAKMALLRLDSSSGNNCTATTVWAVAQVTFAIEVTVAWIFDIDMEFQAEWDTNINGGPCQLPDVL
jgi:hypothetical protein